MSNLSEFRVRGFVRNEASEATDVKHSETKRRPSGLWLAGAKVEVAKVKAELEDED